eukprot:2024931-Prymnesium_polylepis.1
MLHVFHRMRDGINVADMPRDVELPDVNGTASTSLRAFASAAFYDKRLTGGLGFRISIKGQQVRPFSKTRDIYHSRDSTYTLQGGGGHALTIRFTIGWADVF